MIFALRLAGALVLLVVGFATAVVGFAAGVARAVPERPEGDYTVATSMRGYGLLLVAFLVLLVALATLPRPRRGALPEEQPPST